MILKNGRNIMVCRLYCRMLVLLPCILSGCGGGTNLPPAVIVIGRVLNHGEPLLIERPDVGVGMIQVTLISADGADVEGDGTQAGRDGRFEIRGPGKGVRPGRYKLAVRQWKDGPGTKDQLRNRFSPQNSPITLEVPGSAVGSNYDLGDLELSKYEEQGS